MITLAKIQKSAKAYIATRAQVSQSKKDSKQCLYSLNGVVMTKEDYLEHNLSISRY